MNKNLVVKLVIFLVVASLVYSVFWFFKVGQIEKQITSFITENSAYASSGVVSVSGFPLSQKITIKDFKFTIPNPVLNKNQVVVKSLEAQAKIFSTSFSVTFSEGITLQDLEGNSTNVEFNKEPEIKISISDGRISNFSYQDSGYKILDAQKNVTYAASSSMVLVDSSLGSDEKITTKITANVKDIEGFDVVTIYKNAFEKKIVEGIKTGEISLSTNPATVLPPVDVIVATADDNKSLEKPVEPQVAAIINEINKSVSEAVIQAQNAASLAVQANPAEPAKPEEIAAAAVPNEAVKSNFVIDLEYILTPIKNEDKAAKEAAPSDPTQIQEMPLQYVKAFKVNSLEFSNPLYKILINGEMNSYIDDSMPSGSLAIKVEKINSLISHISSALTKMVEQKKQPESSAPKVAELSPATADASASAQPATPTITPVAASIEDPYQAFLKKVSVNFSQVVKELAAKNAVSKDEIAEFDIRREKNLEFLVNETSAREILGKF